MNMVQGDGPSQGGGKSFDFNSERGVREVLLAIRSAELSISIKNELRDLVFLYANGKGDLAIRNVLEERLQTYNIKPLPGGSSIAGRQQPVSGPGFSSGRPSPVFAPVSVKPVASPSVAARTETVVKPSITSASTPIGPTPVIRPTIPPTAQVSNASKTEAVLTPEPVAAKAPASPVVPADPLPSNNTDVYLERIREIKADVNDRVGNPVNLVDIDNNIGREYMASLLEAMKQLNGGGEEAVKKAMQKLEIVYEQVKVLVETKGAKTTGSVSPSPAPQPVIPPTPSPIPQPAVSPEPRVVPTVDIPKPVDPVVPVTEAVTMSAPVTPITPETKEPVPNMPVSSGSGSIVSEQPVVPPKATDEASKTRIQVRPPTEPASGDRSVVAITSTRFNVGTPVAAATPLRTIEELPTAASLKTSSTGDPLYTKEVDDGLEQLLEEWSLFKKSGLFGTGPKGREHPLFKKIANLQIPLLLSGRFEGSTQEIKQSITDYMNGWRYEQGIVYQQGETFEQYLRRVIRHIIDWQNKKIGS